MAWQGFPLPEKEWRHLFHQVASSQAADAVDLLTWQDFEKLVAEAFQRDGYTVAENGGGGPDGGRLDWMHG